MDLHFLRTFVVVAKKRSFTKAADDLFLAQPTVSHHIKVLEAEIGKPLFYRGSRDVRLTNAGEILLKYAEDILFSEKSFLEEMNRNSFNVDGLITIATSSIPERFILPGILKKFLLKFPNVRFSIISEDSESAEKLLLSGGCDLAITGFSSGNPNISSNIFFSDEILFAAPTSLVEDFSDSEISFEDIVNLPLARREKGSGTRSSIESFFNCDLDDIKHKVIDVHSQASIEAIISNSIACGFVSSTQIACFDLDSVRIFRPKGGPIVRDFYIISHLDTFLSPAVSALKDFIIS